jgi:hypothetical protein
MTLNFQSFNIKLYYTLSCVCVTTDGVLDWILDLLTTLTHDLQLHLINSAITNFHTLQITG